MRDKTILPFNHTLSFLNLGSLIQFSLIQPVFKHSCDVSILKVIYILSKVVFSFLGSKWKTSLFLWELKCCGVCVKSTLIFSSELSHCKGPAQTLVIILKKKCCCQPYLIKVYIENNSSWIWNLMCKALIGLEISLSVFRSSNTLWSKNNVF